MQKFIATVPVGGGIPSGPYTAGASPLPLSSIDSYDCGRGPYFDYIQRLAVCAASNSGLFVKSITTGTPLDLLITGPNANGVVNIDYTGSGGGTAAQYPFVYTATPSPLISPSVLPTPVPANTSFLMGPGGGTNSPSLFYDGDAGALRVGTAGLGEWSSNGAGSFAAGDNNAVGGAGSGAFGSNNSLAAPNSLVVGANNTVAAAGENALVVGRGIAAPGAVENSLVVGDGLAFNPSYAVSAGSIVGGTAAAMPSHPITNSLVYVGGADISGAGFNSYSPGIRSAVALFGGEYDRVSPRSMLSTEDVLSASFRNGFALSSGPKTWDGSAFDPVAANGLGATIHVQPAWVNVDANSVYTYSMPAARDHSLIHFSGFIVIVGISTATFLTHRWVLAIGDGVIAKYTGATYAVDNIPTSSVISAVPDTANMPSITWGGLDITINNSVVPGPPITRPNPITVAVGFYLTFTHLQPADAP